MTEEWRGQTDFVLANPRAVKEIRRFCDDDLNRQYTSEKLADITLGSYEANRAKVLDALMGPKASSTPAADFIIDMHTTTTTFVELLIECILVTRSHLQNGIATPWTGWALRSSSSPKGWTHSP